MSTPKVRKTLTLDPELVDALGDDEAGLSSTVNAILREEVERRQRRAALSGLLARLELERGSVDEEQVEEFRRLLR
ncbi:MAG: hypothetical protein M3469_09195 [Actinomycetota bacterium]|jgi:hypothetical protein|nr:hypothetical protein [Actinomycetota bacterium]MDQ3410143.1 hypothetical protein [Actinomycetota bacterium]